MDHTKLSMQEIHTLPKQGTSSSITGMILKLPPATISKLLRRHVMDWFYFEMGCFCFVLHSDVYTITLICFQVAIVMIHACQRPK